MKNNKITVVMPSLNVVTYIEDCLQSVLQQSLHELEILIVDAGSTDGTLEIIESYCKRDARLRLIQSPIKSYGYQVNLGIQEAKSEYIGIVETDDTIHPKMYETLYETILENDCDYVKCNHNQVFTISPGNLFYNKWACNLMETCEYGTVFNPSQNLEMLLKDEYVWQGIYRKEFLDKNHIRFNESKGAAYQDIGFLFQVGVKGQKAVYLEEAYYHYRRDNENSSIYQDESFTYIVQELQYIKKVLEHELNQQREVESIYYARMAQQIWYRLCTVSMLRQSYEQVASEIEEIRKQLRAVVDAGVLTEKNLSTHLWHMLQDFICHPRLLSQSLDIQYEMKRNHLKELIEYAKSQKQVIIFGSGKWGRFCKAILEKSGITTIVAFCDNNLSLVGTELDGKPIISVEQATKEREFRGYIIANQRYASEMFEQLQEQGVLTSNIKKYFLGHGIEWFNLLP